MSKHATNGASKHKIEQAVRGHDRPMFQSPGTVADEPLTDFSALTPQASPDDTDKHGAVADTEPAPSMKEQDRARGEAFDAKVPGLRAKLLEVAEEEIAKANAPGGNDGAMKCALGIENLDGVPTIVWHVGAIELRLSPIQATDLGNDLLMMAREVQIPSRIAAAQAEKNK